MATLNELEELLEEPVATEEYAAQLRQALGSLSEDTSVRALALVQAGQELLAAVEDLLAGREEQNPDNFQVTKNGVLYMGPGERTIRIPAVLLKNKSYVFHTTHTTVAYDDGVPDDVADIFAYMRRKGD